MLCLKEVELGGKFYFLRLLYFSWKRANLCFPGLLFGSPQSLQESCYISISVSKTLAWACHNRRRSLQVQYRANVLVASHAALWKKNCGIHSSLELNTALWRLAPDRTWHLSPVRPDAAWKIHRDEELEEIDISPATFTSGRARWAELTLVMDARSWQT